MLRQMLRSKIRGLKVTRTELYYEGSITLDADLLERADILPGERVLVVNLNNGSRMETYTIQGEAGSHDVTLNGPAARLGYVGDEIIVLCFGLVEGAEALGVDPKIVHVCEGNVLPE